MNIKKKKSWAHTILEQQKGSIPFDSNNYFRIILIYFFEVQEQWVKFY